MSQFNVTDDNPAADRLHPINENFQPLHNRILVRRIPLDYANAPAIVVPQCAQLPSRRGVVVRVGWGKRDSDGYRRPLDVRPGDVIYFGRYTDFDDGDLLLITEQDIVGIVS